MYCSKCGKDVRQGANFCSGCGARFDNAAQPQEQAQYGYVRKPVHPDDRSSFWWGVLGFLLGLVAIILWAVWKDEYPKRSKSVLTGLITGVIISVVLVILIIALGVLGLLGEYS